MKHWIFDLFPSTNFTLTYTHINSNDFVIAERMGEMPYTFNFGSSHFDSIEDSQTIYIIGEFLIKLLNGHSYLIYENKDEVREFYFGDLNNEHEKKISKSKEVSPLDFVEIDQYLTEKLPVIDNDISKLINLALEPGLIRNILLIAGSGMTYSDLYKILDEIKLFLKGKDKVENLINKKALNRFTHTANNYETIGLSARHGTTNSVKPKDPMSLKESQSLITNLVSIVLKKHFNITLSSIPDNSESFSVENLF